MSMMMMTNQAVAFTPAQPQPFASSSPKKARLRATMPPGPSACSAICPPCERPRDLPPDPPLPPLLDRERPRHVRVDHAGEAVRTGREGRDVVGPGVGPAEDLALPDHLAGGRVLVDRDVMRDPRIVVRELDLERDAGTVLELT